MPISKHPGLRLSFASFFIFALGLGSLLFLPSAVAVVLTLAGGIGVWSGFVWTLFSWYTAPSSPPEP